MKKTFVILSVFSILMAWSVSAFACTGIALKAADGNLVQGRTIEWGGGPLPSLYVITPRGHVFQSLTPDGHDGMKYTAKYGWTGLAVVQQEFVAEGINEAGLSAGLFYFPGYGSYTTYDPCRKEATLSDLEVVSWMLSSFADVNEVKAHFAEARVVSIYPDNAASAIHWRVADACGNQIVIEIVNNGEVKIYDNPVGVLANSPDFQWQLTNLNNYVNLRPGTADAQKLGDASIFSFGAGSNMLGLPGDVTPPSRFVRAAFLKATAPVLETSEKTVFQCFHLLNNFDVPIGVEHEAGKCPDIPSATQWTAVTDIAARRIYYKTSYNNTIRCIDLRATRLDKVKYQSHPLDKDQKQPVEMISIR